MYSARAFQLVADLVRQWWLLGFQVDGQYALTDSAQADRLQCYTRKVESQTRGCLHLHVLVWSQPLLPCIAAPQCAEGFEEEGE